MFVSHNRLFVKHSKYSFRLSSQNLPTEMSGCGGEPEDNGFKRFTSMLMMINQKKERSIDRYTFAEKKYMICM